MISNLFVISEQGAVRPAHQQASPEEREPAADEGGRRGPPDQRRLSQDPDKEYKGKLDPFE